MTEFECQLLAEMRAIRVAIEKKCVEGLKNEATYRKSRTIINEEPIRNYEPSSELVNLHSQSGTFSNIRSYYFGTPDGAGFDENNTISDIDNPRVMYVVETMDGITGRFYPLSRSVARLRGNAKSFLLPLCELSDSIDFLDTINVTPDQYGEVTLVDGYWKVVRKCLL